MSAAAAAPRNNEQKIRRHDDDEPVGFGFVIIELLVRYSPPRRVLLFGFESTTETTLLNQSALSCQHFIGSLIFAEDGTVAAATPQRVGLHRWNALTKDAALPLGICASGDWAHHRLQEKPIHLKERNSRVPDYVVF
jgi:hypothetical protein